MQQVHSQTVIKVLDLRLLLSIIVSVLTLPFSFLLLVSIRGVDKLITQSSFLSPLHLFDVLHLPPRFYQDKCRVCLHILLPRNHAVAAC